jgi:protein-S-isoprenylcysteine O-methyltransferase Ste14
VEQFLKLVSSPDQLIFVAAILLILLGIITPKKFLGIEVDWTPVKSACVLIIGLAILGYFVWHRLTAPIEIPLSQAPPLRN